MVRLLEGQASEQQRLNREGKLADARELSGNDENLARIEDAELLDSLEQVAGLSPQQTAVWRRLRQGMEIAEIAVELGISKNSVSVQKNNAIKKLKEARRAAGL